MIGALRDARAVRWLSYGGAVAIGVCIVLSLFPRDVLLGIPLSDDRLSGDIAQHVAGQRAFLQDSWHWPLLRTTMLGWPRGVSIAMTDSIPLIALPLKLFARWLPPGFTAIQLWLAFAYMMQPVAAVFALRSAGVRRLLPALAIAAIAISMPTFLARQGHSALSSHFTILLAIGSYFRTVTAGKGRFWLPPALQVGSFLVHPYLGFMVAAVLCAAPVSLAFRQDRRWLQAAGVVAGGLLLTAIGAFCLGYGADAPTEGFGEYAMNGLAPFYPTYSGIFHVAPVWDSVGWTWEGYQYLGAGLFLLIVAGLATLGPRGVARLSARHIGLLLACVALTGLALSNVVYLGHHRLFHVGPVPHVLNQLRISARLFWPVAYLALVSGVVLVVRRARPLPATVVLVCAVALQVFETHELRAAVAANFRRSAVQPIDPARLAVLVRQHEHVTVMPTDGCGLNQTAQEFLQIVLAASEARKSVNTMYTARSNKLGPCDDGPAAAHALYPNELRFFLGTSAHTGPLAVPGHDEFCRAFGPVAACTMQTSMLADLPKVEVPALTPDRPVDVGSNGSRPILGVGWYGLEPGGVWSAGSRAFLAFRPDAAAKSTLKFVARASLPDGMGPRTVQILIDGAYAANWTVAAPESSEEVPVPEALVGASPDVLVEIRRLGPLGYGEGIFLRAAGIATPVDDKQSSSR